MSAMALGQAAQVQAFDRALGRHGEWAAVWDAAGGLRRCKADSVRLAAVGLPSLLHLQRVRLSVRAGAGNTYGTVFRVTTFGESHGGGVGCIIDGCLPRLPLSEADMQEDLDRRRPGQSRITTPRNETDTCKVISGVGNGLTLGTPIAVTVPNTDQRGGDYSEMSVAYRPSHADATYDYKYGVRAIQGGGRSSARETTGRVAAGAVAKKLLKLKARIKVLASVSWVHGVELPEDVVDHDNLTLEQIENNIVRRPHKETANKMSDAIDAVCVKGDSVGGVVTCIDRNVPKGLGTARQQLYLLCCAEGRDNIIIAPSSSPLHRCLSLLSLPCLTHLKASHSRCGSITE